MISQNILSIRTVPAWLWNLLAISCALLAAVAVLSIIEYTTAPPALRLAFAILGYAAVIAGLRGRLLYRVAYAAKYIKKRFHRVIPGFIALSIMMSIVFLILMPVMKQVQTYAREAQLRSLMKMSGLSLLEFAKDHNQTLPPNITPQTIGNYLKMYEPELSLIDPISEKPFIWRHSLSRINIKKIKHPEDVIVAYSHSYYDGSRRMVLFLDGRANYKTDDQFWELMHKQQNLLQGAKP